MGTGGRRQCLLLAIFLLLAMLPLIVTYGEGVGDRPSGVEYGLAVVVNRANPIENLSSAELRNIFLGTRSHWQNGRRIAVTMLDYERPERKAVLRQIYRMDESGYRNHFLQEVYRGDVFYAPKTLASPAVMRKFIFNAPAAIGYLRSSDVDETVKVLRVDGYLPDDKGYPLQIDEPM